MRAPAVSVSGECPIVESQCLFAHRMLRAPAVSVSGESLDTKPDLDFQFLAQKPEITGPVGQKHSSDTRTGGALTRLR